MGWGTQTVALAVGLVLGCGDGSEGAGAHGASGGGTAGQDSAGAGGLGVGGTAGAGGESVVGVGFISLLQIVYDDAMPPYLMAGLSAEFYPPQPGIAECEELAAPPGCHVTVCERDPSIEPAEILHVGAGAIGVTGGAYPLEAQPGPTATYDEPFKGPLFEGGEMLTIDVEGSVDVPAFSLALQAQSPVIVSEPDFDAPTPSLRRDAPLSFAWSGGEYGYVVARVSQTVASESVARDVDVYCFFDGASGEGELPVSMLNALSPSTAVDSQTLAVFAISTATTGDSGPWIVNASTHVTAASPAGATAVLFDFTVE